MLKASIPKSATVKITFVYRALRNGLLTLKATTVPRYWKHETQKTEVFSKLLFALSPFGSFGLGTGGV
jgi:hypothetical protein